MSEKYCVLPGQQPVRLASTTGHVIIVGETPRDIPTLFIEEARGKGCYTEKEVADIKSRIMGEASPGQKTDSDSQQGEFGALMGQGQQGSLSTPDAGKAGEEADPRVEAIKNATIEILNIGNPEELTSGNKPKVEALEAKLSYQISAQERDAAFEAITATM
jgi:hypothetical protein